MNTHDHHDLIIDAVTDEPNPPIVSSSVFGRTKAEYQHMTDAQRRDFCAANACTFGGVALTLAAYGIERTSRKNKKLTPFLMRAAGYALDFADGYYAKRSITPDCTGATTEFGRIADPLADKFNNLTNEIALFQSDDMHVAHPILRTSRDVAVSLARRSVTKASHGSINVQANKFGKFNTLARDTANLFASTPLASRYPRVNGAIQSIVDTYSIASGAYTIADLYRRSRNQ